MSKKTEKTQPEKVSAITVPPPRWLLKLDAAGVFHGARRLADDEEVAEGDVVLDHEPDNPPGKYRWDRDNKRLEALPKGPKFPAAVPLDVDGMRALRALILHLRKGGEKLPADCTNWADAFGKTIDGR